MEKNRIPAGVHKIHLIAICGTAMGALAAILKDLGFEVTGSDQKIYPPMSLFLEKKGIRIHDGFKAEHIAYGPDLVVVGNAVTRQNPEAVTMLQSGLNFCSMPQALNHFVGSGKKTLLVSGTHGKTTTAAILAWILQEGGFDPSFMIGGILQDFDSNYRLGNGPYFVVEGDEYDTAFFDKGPKLMHFHPETAILTSLEFDHADIFDDLEHVKKTFNAFIAGLAADSLLLAYDGDENIADLIQRRHCRIQTYGHKKDSAWRLGGVCVDSPWTMFEVFRQGEPYATFRTRLCGEHNLLNALADIALADQLNIPKEVIASALTSFQGVKRRQEIRGQKRQITVMDDFAHHPTAVRETIRAVASFYPKNRLIAVFEPRTNTSMRKVFQHEYPRSFDPADLICIRKPPLLEKIPAGERFSSEQLVEDLQRRGKSAYYFAETEAIIDFLLANALPGDLILIMSNGGFDNIHQRLLDRL